MFQTNRKISKGFVKDRKEVIERVNSSIFSLIANLLREFPAYWSYDVIGTLKRLPPVVTTPAQLADDGGNRKTVSKSGEAKISMMRVYFFMI